MVATKNNRFFCDKLLNGVGCQTDISGVFSSILVRWFCRRERTFVGDSSKQAEKNENNHSLKIMANATRIAGVLDFLKGFGEGDQERSLSAGTGIHGKTSVFYVF